MTKKQVGEEFILLTLPDYSPSLEEVRTETQAQLESGGKANTEAMERCCWLTCFTWLDQPPLF